jgi:predicted nucleotidyltransferase
MRLDDKIKCFLKQEVAKKIPGAKVYLFGSRTNNDALGGDIDVLLLSEEPVNKRIIRHIRVEFYKQFGWQKLDVVNFTFRDNSVFKQLIVPHAIEL